jgi:hypothetical protein
MAGCHAREMARLSVAISVIILLSACGDSPMSPGAANGPPAPTYTLSGLITVTTGSGSFPVGGARVEESNSHRITTTNQEGLYSIPGLQPTNNFVTVSKAGYISDTRPVTINGDTRLDIEVALVEVVTYTLTGVVSEMTETGLLPVEGVQLYCDGCGSEFGHTFMYTDSNGFYSFSWLYPGYQTLLVSKEGYRTLTGQPLTMTVTGDTRLDIQLVRR